MPFSPRKALPLVLILTFAACSSSQPPAVHVDPSDARAGAKTHGETPSTTTPTTVDAEAVFRWNATIVLQAEAKDQTEKRVSNMPRNIPTKYSGPHVVYPPSFQPCDGAYPPCWRVGTESGGNYNAYNPGGCGGSGCYGKWQFSGEWAGKLGLPADLSTATPAQQDEAARQLWNGGAGCSNWAAC